MAEPAHDPDKTTFVGAAGSFLDIFCIDYAAQQEDEVNQEALPQPEGEAGAADKPRAQGKFALVMGKLGSSFGAAERAGLKRAARWGGILAVAVVALLLFLYFRGAPERERCTDFDG
ncbi:hypothetical protein ACU4GD_32765 [Cupriavidus basilensis]